MVFGPCGFLQLKRTRGSIQRVIILDGPSGKRKGKRLGNSKGASRGREKELLSNVSLSSRIVAARILQGPDLSTREAITDQSSRLNQKEALEGA